ncbi:MAG TPA: hypothetical protein VJ953_08490 [Saprospiraceae bacterium]|nr:hypothetical protein [Saprospiraceae bacterium]
MRLRTLFFIAAFLFVAGGLALRHHPYFQQPIDQLSVPVLAVSADQVQTISIERGEQELLLTKEGNQWLATNGQWSNPVEEQRIRDLLGPTRRVSSLGIAAQSMEDWRRQLPGDLPEMTWVRIYAKNKLLESFYLAPGSQPDSLEQEEVYLRLPRSEVIYRIPAAVGRAWLQPFQLYREQQLLSFDPTLVRGFTIWTDTLAQRFRLADSVWQDSLGQVLPDQKVRTWLKHLSNLKGKHYADQFNEVEKRPVPFLALDFYLANQGTIRLEAFADSNRLDLPFVIRSNQFTGRYFRSDSVQLKDLIIK